MKVSLSSNFARHDLENNHSVRDDGIISSVLDYLHVIYNEVKGNNL